MPFPAQSRVAADTAERAEGGTRAWAETDTGPIANWQDFEQYPWPEPDAVDLFPLEYICEHMPEGMGLISCHAGGILEHVTKLFGYVGLCTALYDVPDLVRAVVDAVGERIERYHQRLLDLDGLVAVFQGDDMGFRSGTLISPEHLRQYFLPWHKRFARLAHDAGRPYFLHACGNIEAVMDDLIDDVGIDAKHSFEDAIVPVAEMKRRYGDRIGILGGVDVDVLGRAEPEVVRRTVREVIDTCGPGGRYAVGSGNSIPSYIPVENYLTMLDEALA
jgi:uroporphyrinogen decarboxylase